MSDVFLSYAKEDRERARFLAQALAGLGWSVFWDRTVPAGLTWREFIGKELDEARSVVVAWSEASVRSQWVLEEAEQAKRKRILIPVLIQPVEPPFGFGSLQAADLSGWDGSVDDPALLKMVEDMARVLGAPPSKIEAGAQERTKKDSAPTEIRSHTGRQIEEALVSGEEEMEGGQAGGQRKGGQHMTIEQRGRLPLGLAAAATVALALALLWAFLRIGALERALTDQAQTVGDVYVALSDVEDRLPKDGKGPLRIVSGQTEATDWQQYGDWGLFVTIDLSDAGFEEKPLYFISLYGLEQHWTLTGTSSVYSVEPDSFQVYLKADPAEFPKISKLTPQEASRRQWRVSWLAVGR